MTLTPPVTRAGGALLQLGNMGYTTALGHTPTFAIYKDGTDITDNISDRVISLTVVSNEGQGEGDTLDIVIDDRDWNIALPDISSKAATLSIALGYQETGIYPVGTFQIDEVTIEWPSRIVKLHGTSLGMNTNAKAPIIASYENKSLGDIIGSIAESAQVAPAVDPKLAGIQIPYLNQSTSSMHMLQELERKFNGLAKFSDGYLSFTERGACTSASGQSIGTFILGPDDFGPSRNSVRMTSQYAYSEVKVGWFDRETQTHQWVKSTVPGSPGSETPYTVRRVQPSQVEAQSLADSTMSALNRKCKDGTLILAKGHPAIRGGQGFAIIGCRDGIFGTSYLVSRAVHTLAKKDGLMTTIDFYDEGNGIDFSQEATSDMDLDFSAIAPTTLPTVGIGRM